MSTGKVLVTGCAGFIGSSLVDDLLKKKISVVGIDNLNDYYHPIIKVENLKIAKKNKLFKFYEGDILNLNQLKKIFKKEKPDIVVHLAARAGVRPSIANPLLYSVVNKFGTVNLLSVSKDEKVKKFIFGSSSSVYGKTKRVPFSEDDKCENLASPYGASKRAAEFFVETFAKVYGLKSVVLRFFTVYGPRGRPDMAPFLFANALLNNKKITQFGNGSSSRDYTYVDDIVEGIVSTFDFKGDFEIINLGNSYPVKLLDFISLLEEVTEKSARIVKKGKQIGDVDSTWASIIKAKTLLGWRPKVQVKDGLVEYVKWLKSKS